MKKAFRTTFVMALAALLWACSGEADTNSPKHIVEQYAEAIIKGDYRGALDLVYFGGETEEAQQLHEAFTNLCEEMAKEGLKESDQLVRYQLGEEEIDEAKGKAIVQATLTYADGHSKEDEIHLLRNEQGLWLVDETN